MKNIFRILTIAFSLFVATGALAKGWKVGKIKHTYSHQTAYSGCLVMLDVPIGDANNQCPANGYFSLDCMGKIYNNAENSKRMFSEALAAMHADKTVRVYIDDTKKVNSYCVAAILRVDK